MNKNLVILLVLLAALAGGAALWGQDAAAPSGSDPRLQSGMAAFNGERYREALDQFSSLLADPRAGSLRPEASYWSVLTYVALGDPVAAEKAIQAYLAAYPTGERRPDLLYQLGRLQFARGDYEKSLQTFSDFLVLAPDHSLVPAALYWGGESLFALGRLDDADKVFKTVIDRYPGSVKVEAAKYRREVISLESREKELLRLLSWSHEESLKAAEDFRQREKVYEDTLAAYQRQVADAQKLADQANPALKAKITDLQTQLAASQAELEKAKANLDQAKAEAQAALAKALDAQKAEGSPAPQPTPPPQPMAMPSEAAASNEVLLAQALDAKRRALDLLAFYLEKLSSGGSK